MSQAGLQFGNHFVLHSDLMERVAKAASALESIGVKRDDTVALMLRNDVVFMEATLGIRQLGAMPVPVNWHLSAEELEYILNDSGSKAIVIHSDLYEILKAGIPDGVTVLEVPTP